MRLLVLAADCYYRDMYFESREQAGQLLSEKLSEAYRYENCAVMALNDGGVIVGEPIAARLHSILTMLLSEEVEVPGEGLSFGGVSMAGDFTYNNVMSEGEQAGYTMEFHGYLEEQKRQAFQRMNRLLADGGVVDRSLLTDRIIILVSDGLDSSMPLQVARDYLKPVRYRKLVVAAPVASASVVNQMHVMADELHVLDVRENYFDTNHYYTNNAMPPREELINKINNIVLSWQ